MENYNRLFLLEDPEMGDDERIEFIRTSGETQDYEDYIKADAERKPGHINLSQIDESRGFIKMEGLKNFEAPIYNLEKGKFEVGNLFDFVHDIALGDQLTDIQKDALTEIELKNAIAKTQSSEPQKYEHTISEYTEETYDHTQLISPSSSEEFKVALNIADGMQSEFVFDGSTGLESISEVKFVLYNGVVVEEFVVNEPNDEGTFIGKTTVSIIDKQTGDRVIALEGARVSIYGTTFKPTDLKQEIGKAKEDMQVIEDGAQNLLDMYITKLSDEKTSASIAVQDSFDMVKRVEDDIRTNKREEEKQHAELLSSRDEDSIETAKNRLIDLGNNGLELKTQFSEAYQKFDTLRVVLSLKVDEETGELVADEEGNDAYVAAEENAKAARKENNKAFNTVMGNFDLDADLCNSTLEELRMISDKLTGRGK